MAQTRTNPYNRITDSIHPPDNPTGDRVHLEKSEMNQKFRVVIVDDHPLLRVGLRTALTADSGFEVVGEAGNGRDGVHAVEQLAPDDLALMDLTMR